MMLVIIITIIIITIVIIIFTIIVIYFKINFRPRKNLGKCSKKGVFLKG